MNLGTLGYLRLADFEPEWRQGVLIPNEKDKRGKKLIFAVRILEAEIEDKSSEFTPFDVEDHTFILVEGNSKNIRQTCLHPHRAIEVGHHKVLQRALEVLARDDIQFATASEGQEPMVNLPKQSVPVMPEQSESEFSAESGDSEDEDILKLLKAAGRKRAEGGLPSGSTADAGKKKSKSRYPLLAAKEKKTDLDTTNLDGVMQALLSKQGADPNALNTLVQLEMLRELRGRGKKKTQKNDEWEDDASHEATSTSDNDEKLKGAGKALKAFRKGKRSMKRNPERHIKRYIREVEEQLGASADSSYLLTDYTRRLTWGKHRTLMRIHFALSHLLQTLLKGQLNQGALQVTQLLRATHQAALDGGEWRTAWLLLDLADPLEKPRFGGEAQQLELVAGYVRALSDLEKKSRTFPPKSQEEEVEKPGKGGGKKKSKKPETQEE